LKLAPKFKFLLIELLLRSGTCLVCGRGGAWRGGMVGVVALGAFGTVVERIVSSCNDIDCSIIIIGGAIRVNCCDHCNNGI
jgi:hypothetical protein